ncbi:carboxylesterase family protein, partial [Salmonella sp. gx-f4]|nr:carboxylesterase family protein [Salmonella sp. gx-f4]
MFSKGYSSNFEISPYTKREETMSKILCTMLTNFVKNGDPSTTRLSIKPKHDSNLHNLFRFSWPIFSGNSSQYVSLDVPLK